MDNGKVTALTLLDLSAAFDTIDHATLLERLYGHFGISGTVLQWLKSYISNRQQRVQIDHDGSLSCPQDLHFSVLQRSVLGPFLFCLYTASISQIITTHDVSHHMYADDTQVYIELYGHFGISGTVLQWLKSYISNRQQRVQIDHDGSLSCPQDLHFSVLQRSVLGPFLFCLYTASISQIITTHDVSHHMYADDTQVYIELYGHFGISGTVLQWLKSYISNRQQRVQIDHDGSLSCPQDLHFSVLQRSVLGPFLFCLYTASISQIITTHDVSHHMYADDTQVYIELSQSDTHKSISSLSDSCYMPI